MLPDLLYHSEVGDSDLNGQGDTQGNVAEYLLIVLIPAFCFVSGMGSAKNEPLALSPEVGLHGGVPLLPVGASEDGDHFVESTGHHDNSCCEVNGVSK